MPPYLIHAVLMAGALLLMASGVFVAMRLRKERWWFKTHRRLGLLGAGTLLLGGATAVLMVARASGEHLQGPHAWLGLATILAGIVTACLGWLQFRIKKRPIRIIHHWAGRAVVLMQAAAIALGLRLIGIL